MKKISSVWFLKTPYDPEHKEYVLLDFLKSLGKKVNPENCYSTLRQISKLVKDLNHFKEHKSVPPWTGEDLNKEEKKLADKFSYDSLEESEKEALDEIIEDSLETLYAYSEICLEILKDEESKIKIFKIDPKLGKPQKSNSGVLIVRNMVSDVVFPYIWQGAVTLKTDQGDKQICILKKVFIKNCNFSLNYEHIYHEVLQHSGIQKTSPELFVIEIYENFDEESEIYKLAKEKFVESISK